MTITHGTYKKNDANYLGDLQQYKHPKENFKIVVNSIRSVYGQNSISLIDIGCASGAFIYYAKQELNLQICAGTDISELHLIQAREYLADVEFVHDSITAPQYRFNHQFDVCVCLGTMSIFDEIDQCFVNLLNYVKSGGCLYISDLVNDYPVDVIMRYRLVQAGSHSDWQAGFNVRSKLTYEHLIQRIAPGATWIWRDFEMPFAITPSSNPMRAWTMQTEHKSHQLVVGTGQLLNFKILQIIKA